MPRGSSRTPPGSATDAKDPTWNVRDLVDAAERRQDDLRAMEGRHLREMSGVRGEKRTVEFNGLRELSTLRDEHTKELRAAEAARIDAIRTIDVEAVQQGRIEQDTRASALASQVADAAEAMRSQVAATAEAAATALATALNPILAAIEQLRQAMYEAQGQKAQVVETQAKDANSWLWVGLVIAGLGMVVAVFMLVIAAVTLAALLTHGFTK